MKTKGRKIVTQRLLQYRGGFAALVIAASAIGCAELREKEELAFNAGFKMVAPIEPHQKAILAKLVTGKLIQTSYRGITYYVLPDPNYGQAYVGGRREYEAYRRLRLAEGLGVEAPQVNEAAAMDWSALGRSASIGELQK
jgi:hypothetical protein